RVTLALSKLREKLVRRGVVVPVLLLPALMAEKAIERPPNGLAAKIKAGCLGKTAVSATAAATAKTVMKTVSQSKLLVAGLVLAGAALISIPTVLHIARTPAAPAP